MTAKRLLIGLFAVIMTAGAFAPAVMYAQQTETSYKDLIKTYEAGDKSVALQIAMDYKYGWDGAAVNGKKAVEWLDNAFNAGITRAATMAGTMYYAGDVVKQDYSKAEKYYRKAASKGDENAQIRLGRMYYFGNGVKTNYESAFRWYSEAAKKYEDSSECSVACLYLGQIYHYGWKHGEKYQSDNAAAVMWLEKAYDAGYIEASTLLSDIYSSNAFDGVKQNKAKARKYLVSAAGKGYAPAMRDLATDYLNGINGSPNYIQAYVWAAVLAERDGRAAPRNLMENAKGKIPAKNISQAEKLSLSAIKKYENIKYVSAANDID